VRDEERTRSALACDNGSSVFFFFLDFYLSLLFTFYVFLISGPFFSFPFPYYLSLCPYFFVFYLSFFLLFFPLSLFW